MLVTMFRIVARVTAMWADSPWNSDEARDTVRSFFRGDFRVVSKIDETAEEAETFDDEAADEFEDAFDTPPELVAREEDVVVVVVVVVLAADF